MTFSGLCDPVKEGNVCYVIIGDTTILLDGDVSEAKTLAYDAIIAGLTDQAFLAEFAPDLASAHFLRRLRDTFVMIPPTSPDVSGSQSPPVTSAIAVAAASVSFLLISIFVWGMLRRRAQPQAEHELVSTHLPKTPHLGIKRAKYHEGHQEPSLFHLSVNSPTASTTWSVSDLTSEGSTRSGYSRTTSTLEKIEEEEEELFEDIDQLSNQNEQIREKRSSSQHSYASKGNGSHCIETFDALHHRNTAKNSCRHESILSMLTLEEEPEVVDPHSDLNKQIHENGPSPQHSQPNQGSGRLCIETFDAIDRRSTIEDDSTNESMLSILPLEEEQFQDYDPHPELDLHIHENGQPRQHTHPSQGKGSRSIETFDVIESRNTGEDDGINESMLSILTLSLSRQDDEEQDAIVPKEMTLEEVEQMLVDIFSPISANSRTWIHNTEAIVYMENEAPESVIPTQSALNDIATPSGGSEGDGVLRTGEKDVDVTEQPAPAEHSASIGDYSVARSEEPSRSNVAPISTGEKVKPTVLFEDKASIEQPKQSVLKDDDSMVDNAATTREEEVVTSAKEETGVLQTGIAEDSIVEDPNATNPHGGEVSIDDSLALSADTTDCELCLDGWLARFLFELSVSEKLPRITAEPIIPE